MPAPQEKHAASSEMGNSWGHEDCWAKTKEDGNPGINVHNHCLNVGCVAEALLAFLPAQLLQLVPQGAASLAALHDVGKVSPGFQVKCQRWLEQLGLTDRALEESWWARESDHAKISQFTVQQRLGESRLHPWAAAVGAHHGRIKGERLPVQESCWEAERVRLAEQLIEEFGQLPSELPSDAAIWFEAGLITVADWIGSDERNFPQDALWAMPERRKRARTALASINWRAASTRKVDGFRDLFPELPRPNSLQATTMDLVDKPGVYVVEGPMGCGKTEAALAASYGLMSAGKATGLFFALPTQVTSNRIHLRVQPFVDRISAEPATVRLAHSASWLVEVEPPMKLRSASPDRDNEAQEHVRAGRSWFASAKRALLTPFGVGTIDQALLGIVAAKHFFVRQFGLGGKVVILDEVHTYDLYTGTLVSALVKRLRELSCTVIVLSATLTEKRRRELLGLSDGQPLSAAYPLISGIAASRTERECEPPPSKTIRIRGVSGAIPVLEALERARRGECLLWIRNTVDDAQATYWALHCASSSGVPRLALLHSRFPYFRREELENDWMERLGRDPYKRPAGCILVSTQVAEQSVDIDADLLITDLAPTDMLLQRLGRLWRHDRPGRPCSQQEVWIGTPSADDAFLNNAGRKDLLKALGKSARVYAPYVLLRSLEQWRGRTIITLPNDIREILEATYADPASNEPPGWGELREELERQREKLVSKALNATSVWHNPALPDEEETQTRYSTYPTAHLLLARQITPFAVNSARLALLNGDEITASGRDWNFDAAKAIHRNLIRMPRWAVATALSDAPSWLENYVSQPTAFGIVDPEGRIHWPKHEEPTGLSYNADQGIIIDRQSTHHGAQKEIDESYD